VAITNTAAPLATRVRSYLDANCAPCHQPGGAGAFFDARFDTPLDHQNLINGPVQNPLGISGAKVIAPDSADHSLLFHRVSIVGDNQMPPIARNLVDTRAVPVIAEWINSMQPIKAVLPKPWQYEDIGIVTIPGETSYLRGQFNLVATGKDIWGIEDSFHFASKPFSASGEIIARVVALQYTDPWAKAGIMFRESDDAGAKYAFMGFSGQGGSVFQSRLLPSAFPASTDGPPAKPPYWLKLVRLGDTFTGYVSADGQAWKTVGKITVPMKKDILVGLALASHNKTTANSTLFDNVMVSAGNVTGVTAAR
jgi:regulation of enolase protein 1 (concanavalin A-like superfamily)